MESKPMLIPREKSPLPEKNSPWGGSNPRRCMMHGIEPNTLPTRYSGPITVSNSILMKLRTVRKLECQRLYFHLVTPRKWQGHKWYKKPISRSGMKKKWLKKSPIWLQIIPPLAVPTGLILWAHKTKQGMYYTFTYWGNWRNSNVRF